MAAFIVMSVTACISTAFFAGLSICVLKSLKAVIHEHTGAVSLLDRENSDIHNKMSDKIKKDLEKYLKYCFAATVLYAVTDICYVFLAKDLEFMFFVNAIGSAIFIASYVKAYFEISESVNSRYILE